jgi:uncharacterized protein YceH (UPF0502 family)
MTVELTANEARVIGCLMEKSRITPDQYPLTLNALTNACNQKSSRDPVMSLDPGEVQATVRSLEGKHLVRTEENFRTQVEKYTQRFCNTPFSDNQFDDEEFAIVCVLLLRGPRTPGELRANAGRLHTFGDNAEVEAALDRLMHPEQGAPVVVELPRTPGRRDPEYMHLFSGPVAARPVAKPTVQQRGGPSKDLESRVLALESAVAELTSQLTDLKAHVAPSAREDDG